MSSLDVNPRITFAARHAPADRRKYPCLFDRERCALHGNYIDDQTQSMLVENLGPDGRSIGIDMNSFWLPDEAETPLDIHTKLNAWHTRDSHWGSHENCKGRGPAPPGWIEREYVSVLGNKASDSWWPFDPDDPEPIGSRLKPGDYLEITGTLWQDSPHYGNIPASSRNCWGQLYRNYDGWLEIHPVDSLRRLTAPGPSPYVDSLGGAKKGIKRVIVKAMCSECRSAIFQSGRLTAYFPSYGLSRVALRRIDPASFKNENEPRGTFPGNSRRKIFSFGSWSRS